MGSQPQTDESTARLSDVSVPWTSPKDSLIVHFVAADLRFLSRSGLQDKAPQPNQKGCTFTAGRLPEAVVPIAERGEV